MKKSTSYEEFLYFLQLHIPFKNASLGEEEKRRFYIDFLSCEEAMLAEPMDYFKYKFYELDDSERIKYITRVQYEEMCIAYSTAEARACITDKKLFAWKYAEFMGRDILISMDSDLHEKYVALCEKHPCLMCKPIEGGYGKGVFIFETKDLTKRAQVWELLCKNECMIEEVIRQHESMAVFHAQSVNTIRSVTTCSANGKATLIAAAIRVGRGGSTIDNANGGGIFANIDVKTGQIIGNGTTHFREEHIVHPDTGVSFCGEKIPYWQEFLNVSLKVAAHQPQLGLCCWDWTLTDKGLWALIEGNLSGGIGLNQVAIGCGLKKKVLEEFE